MGTELGSELFFAIYLGLVGVIFAMGEPQSTTEAKWRNATLAFCGILAVVMIMWLAIQIIAALAHITG
jgi:hypothetical protein